MGLQDDIHALSQACGALAGRVASIRVTGRTQQYLSAFGEHLIVEEAERAVAEACAATGA